MNGALGNMTFIITVSAYLVAAYFYANLVLRLLRWARGEEHSLRGQRWTLPAFALTVIDILFLRRLISLNAILWAGEWVFHASVVMVMLSHLRFFFNQAPEFFVYTTVLGKVAAYTLPASLAYILLFRISAFVFVKKYSTSRYNMFLTTVIFLGSVTGYLLRHGYRTDLIAVKHYMTRFFALSPVGFPDSAMFAAHFALALVAVAAIPTHIFAAPLTLLDAGTRQEGIRRLMHDDGE